MEFIRAVVFDWDGVLLDSLQASLNVYNGILKSLRLKPVNMYKLRAASSSDWRTFYLNLGIREDQWLKANDLWSPLYRKEEPILFPDVKRILSFLKRNKLSLGVASNGQTERVGAEIERLGVQSFFEAKVFHEDVQSRKPSPEPILLSLKLLKVETSQAVYIGDTPDDVIASRRAGVRSVALTRGLALRERLESEEPDYIFEDLREMATGLFDYVV